VVKRAIAKYFDQTKT